MHPDLKRIAELAQVDAELERVAKEAAAARSAPAEVERFEREAMATRDTAHSELLASAAQERALNRQLEDYRGKLQSARRILETGMGSSDAAERQMAQCAAILDDVETQLLSVFERQDGQRAALALAETELAKAVAHHTQVTLESPKILTQREAEERSLLPKREALHQELPADLRQRYDMLRAGKKKVAVARLVDGSCQGCQMTVPVQQVADLKRGLIEPCRGCGRFLLL